MVQIFFLEHAGEPHIYLSFYYERKKLVCLFLRYLEKRHVFNFFNDDLHQINVQSYEVPPSILYGWLIRDDCHKLTSIIISK